MAEQRKIRHRPNSSIMNVYCEWKVHEDFKSFVLCNSSRILDVCLWFVLDSKIMTYFFPLSFMTD